MQNNIFLTPFFSAMTLTIAFCLCILAIPFFQDRFWRKGVRHNGKQTLPRLGGVAMIIALFGAIFLDNHLVITREIEGLLVASLIACLVGLWDDFYELSFVTQALLQGVLTAILFVFGIRITALRNPFGEVFVFSEQNISSLFFGFLLLLSFTVLVMNAVNWLDGLDGLLGSISFITFLVIFFLSLKPEVNQPPVAILAIIGAGLVTGFLLFNWHPAKILAGTSGSLLIGLFVTVLAVIAGTKIATALLVLSLPIADALWVIGERLLSGQSIFRPDQRHLHYRLQELGWSEGKIAWFFFLLTGLIGLIALSTEALGKFFATIFVFGIIFFFLVFVAKKTRKLYQTL